MATKLKNLKIKKVDFVDEGANPDAHIRMVKRKTGEGQTAEEDGKKNTGNILKRMFGFIGKAAGMNQEEIDSAMEEIQKGDSVSFGEKLNEAKNRKIVDEIWDICYALQSSLCSILNDEELDSTGVATAMNGSLDEFSAVMQESITEWSNGKAASIVKKSEEVSEAELEIMKAAAERLDETIKKAMTVPNEGPDNNKKSKGDKEEMKIDKSKLTEAERAFLESIEKRCGADDGGTPPTTGGTGVTPAAPASNEQGVTKSTQTQTGGTPAQPTAETDNVYKGLHPAVAAELTALKKFKEEAEDRELGQVAEKYAIIGKKKEDLVPLFKSLRSAGGTAYDDMIAVLDQAVDVVEKSGAFSEVGKSGHGARSTGTVEAKIETIAKGYMEKDSSMDYTAAVAKAWEDHPELVDEYENEAGF